MWPFKAKVREPELKERVADLESDFRRLRIEWEEAIESLERRAASLRARERHQRDKIADNTPESAEAPAALPEGNGGRLTPRQYQIQQQILRRRAGMQQ